VTPDGKVLGRSPKEALKKWQAIPEAERARGAVKVGELGDIDALRTAPTPPAGGLIIKVYYRAFMRDGPGKLRYVVGKDLWHDEDGKIPVTRVLPSGLKTIAWISSATRIGLQVSLLVARFHTLPSISLV
jgi:hypothetical protein